MKTEETARRQAVRAWEPDIHTRLVTLLGTPLRQSYAARMQNRAYRAMGCNLLYFYCETDQTHLAEIVAGLRYLPMAGFAVTKPNKVEILRYLDDLDPFCRRTGSCNTVVRTETGRLIGYNTDGSGFYTALAEEDGPDIPRSRFFCVGAGGVGRAMTAALADHGARAIYITDTQEAAARALAADLNANFYPAEAPGAHFVPYGDTRPIALCDAVLNASGIGMGRSAGTSPLPAEALHAGQFCFDACYNPAKTKFLQDAEARGCRVRNGLSMSLYQGAAQIELWSGQKAPVEVMRDELLQILRENGCA